ncbi:protein of unknown function [Trichlorobacter ammonificans]|uniref:Uncharacterized protein n=1 Tax=Trichlorobacter ammonificans TaxID=2916410 RepID=A0ABM9D475_9BACT|nr:protein of unknown function [Trichlorobacter ammonificans]
MHCHAKKLIATAQAAKIERNFTQLFSKLISASYKTIERNFSHSVENEKPAFGAGF